MKTARPIRNIIFLCASILLLGSCNFPSPISTPGVFSTAGAGSPTPKAGANSAVPATGGDTCGSSADGTLQVCFVGMSDGQTIAATPGKPVRIPAIASGAVTAGISLSIEAGGYTQFFANSANTDPFQAEFSWTPALGAGTYALNLEALTADKSEVAYVSLSVRVTGLAAVSPSPTINPNAVPPEMENQVLGIFSKTFGVTLLAPAVARKYREGVEDPWISTAYIGDEFYEVEVLRMGIPKTTSRRFPPTPP
jgi:hypothetical protein